MHNWSLFKIITIFVYIHTDAVLLLLLLSMQVN